MGGRVVPNVLRCGDRTTGAESVTAHVCLGTGCDHDGTERERIRELEAELAEEKSLCVVEIQRARRAEARVAELERMEEEWHNRALLLAKALNEEQGVHIELKGED
jgi:hypothetical protein